MRAKEQTDSKMTETDKIKKGKKMTKKNKYEKVECQTKERR